MLINNYFKIFPHCVRQSKATKFQKILPFPIISPCFNICLKSPSASIQSLQHSFFLTSLLNYYWYPMKMVFFLLLSNLNKLSICLTHRDFLWPSLSAAKHRIGSFSKRGDGRWYVLKNLDNGKRVSICWTIEFKWKRRKMEDSNELRQGFSAGAADRDCPIFCCESCSM